MKAVARSELISEPYWHINQIVLFTFLHEFLSHDSWSQVSLKCLRSHKSQAQLLPFPPPSPRKRERIQSGWLPHHRRRPMGSRPSHRSIISPNMQWAAAWFVGAASLQRIPSASHLSPLQPANSLTISLKVKSRCMQAVSAASGDPRDWFCFCGRFDSFGLLSSDSSF